MRDAVFADVAELADALDLGSSPVWGGSSTLPVRTKVARQSIFAGVAQSARASRCQREG